MKDDSIYKKINELGIYMILNTTNNKRFYVAATKVKKHIKKTVAALEAGTHVNKHLQNSYNKYGDAAFVVSVVRYFSDADEVEQYLNTYVNDSQGRKRDYVYNYVTPAINDSPTEETVDSNCDIIKAFPQIVKAVKRGEWCAVLDNTQIIAYYGDTKPLQEHLQGSLLLGMYVRNNYMTLIGPDERGNIVIYERKAVNTK